MQIYPKLSIPNEADKLLLLSCCAPCAATIMEALLANKLNFSLLFYNPNIHPEQEYLVRKQENVRFANKYQIPVIDADYDTTLWFQATKHLAAEPERGARCTVCFQFRLDYAAKYCAEHGFSVFTSSLGASRHKNFELINSCGTQAAANYANLSYWTYDWRKACSAAVKADIAKRENFYRQQYCGCIYSLRDTELRKKTNAQDSCTKNSCNIDIK